MTDLQKFKKAVSTAKQQVDICAARTEAEFPALKDFTPEEYIVALAYAILQTAAKEMSKQFDKLIWSAAWPLKTS